MGYDILRMGAGAPAAIPHGSQGPNAPLVGQGINIGNTAWSNPGNVTLQDGSYSTVSVNAAAPSDYLLARKFAFTIPSNAIIAGIEVKIYHKASVDPAVQQLTDLSVTLFRGNIGSSPVGNDEASLTAWANTDEIFTYGGPTDLWGFMWTPSLINSQYFGAGVAVQATAVDVASVDFIAIKIYY